MRKFKCCQEKVSFIKQGKFLIFSLIAIWLGISLFLGELNPVEWPPIYKPMLFLFICPLFAYLSNEKA